MRWPRVEQTIFFEKQQIVEVRSRPVWVVVLEFWFLYVHEFWTHVLWMRVPERFRDKVRDPYWGDPSEAAFHEFYSWSLNVETIDASAKYTDLKDLRFMREFIKESPIQRMRFASKWRDGVTR